MKTKIDFPNIEISHCVRASRRAIWEVLTDTTHWPAWGPSVVQVRCSDRPIRKGSRGLVKTSLGLWVPFVITDFKDERYWSWRVFGIRATGHRVEEVTQGLCRLTFEVPIFGAPYVVVCRQAIVRIATMLEDEIPSAVSVKAGGE